MAARIGGVVVVVAAGLVLLVGRVVPVDRLVATPDPKVEFVLEQHEARWIYAPGVSVPKVEFVLEQHEARWIYAPGVSVPKVEVVAGENETRFEEEPEVHRPPVDAEVVDFFRPPAHVGAPGNRGLEYDPEPGQPVRASAAGEVVFAGSVVHNRFVTVRHRSGLRTAYGYLGWIAVAEGDRVVAGQLVGTTSERFFFSVRAGDAYVDPDQVMSAGRVRLIPHRELGEPVEG